MTGRYTVETRDGWSYVIGPTIPEHAGPWRHGWEAQEYADELNTADEQSAERDKT